MSCPRCEPQAASRRWLWWAALALLLATGAWLEQARRPAPLPPGALQGSADAEQR